MGWRKELEEFLVRETKIDMNHEKRLYEASAGVTAPVKDF